MFLLGFAAVPQVVGATHTLRKHTASAGPIMAAAAAEQRTTSLPPGAVLYVRLETGVSTKASHLRDGVAARVVREVPGGQGIAIPLGAVVRGRIEKLIPSSTPTDRARMLVRFTRLEIPDQPPISITGRIEEVENARESVLTDGTIQGVLASELPLAHLENALEKFGKSDAEAAARIRKLQKKTLGQSDTSIDYPAGTDVRLVLDQALTLENIFVPAVPDQLAAEISASIERMLAEVPQRASGKDGRPGDPLNLVVVGSAEEIRRAFREAGWSEAEKVSGKSIWETVRAVAADQGYSAAPVSQLYLFGHPEDLAVEKMLNTFARRHHLRLWRCPVRTPPGREIWLGAATHDTGLDVRPGVASHAIDEDIDAERAKVGADLLATGRVAVEQLLNRTNPLSQGLTATAAPWKTDGRLLAIELKTK